MIDLSSETVVPFRFWCFYAMIGEGMEWNRRVEKNGMDLLAWCSGKAEGERKEVVR
ncbi:hypothetical protein TSUD_341420 [Trifolium subterraneum]|uniref:Uncharacterized protein n=1 Tax=Trifolium subterraneum TaxID=3900 RepID=A0A2Z6MHK2_TRISU|nr:hypothetical protein TSUD_341420 [Trifolium subterraneum]